MIPVAGYLQSETRILLGISVVDPDPDFYLMRIRMRIQVTKMMRI
jgi:hypothetical protein